MRFIFLVAIISTFNICHAQSASFSHDFELASTDIGLPLIGDKILDSQTHGHDYWWMSQAFYGGACLMYRAGENNPRSWNEFLTIDLPGIGVSALIEILFPPSKDR